MNRYTAIVLLGVLPFGVAVFRHFHRPVEARASTPTQPAPSASAAWAAEVAAIHARGDAEIATMRTETDRQVKLRDERWDKCIAAKGIPSMGYGTGDRWGLVCIRRDSVIYINNTAW